MTNSSFFSQCGERLNCLTLYIGLAWLGAGCGSMPSEGSSFSDEPEVHSQQEPIYQGSLTTAYPSVGFLTDSGAAESCSATMLSETVAITAKHCRNNKMQLEKGYGPPNFIDYPVDADLRHPAADLMLIHLATPWVKPPFRMSGDPSIDPVMTMGPPPPQGAVCTVIGFGKDFYEGPGDDPDRRFKKSATMWARVPPRTDSFVVSGVTGYAAAGDSGGPVVYDSKLVGNINSTNHLVKTSDLTALSLDIKWINDNLGLVPPSVDNSLYIKVGAELRRTDDERGNYQVISGPGTSPAADWSEMTSMAELKVNGVPTLYAIDASYLTEIDPVTGVSQVHGSPIWTGPTTMTATKTALFVTQGDFLWQIDDRANGTGHAISTAWTDAVAMTNLNGLLYIVKDGQLYSVSIINGYGKRLGGKSFSSTGATSIVASGSKLYIQSSDTIFRIDDVTTGAYTAISTGWTGTTSMVSLNGSIFPIQSNFLLRFSLVTYGYTLLGQALWGGATVSAALP